jgi:hypothetical protein
VANSNKRKQALGGRQQRLAIHYSLFQGGSPPQEEKPWHTARRHALRLGVRHVTNGRAALVETT